MRIPNIYSQSPNSATSLPNTIFIFLKQIFIILCGPSLPMRPKARVLALISVMPKLISSVYQQLDCQMHTAEQLLPVQAAWVALPSAHQVKITPTGPLPSSWAGQDANQGQHSSLICLSPLPPLNTGVLHCTQQPLRHTEHMTYSFSISNLGLEVPSTEILKWITDFHTSKHFT
jgi:hypothetical protein